MKRLAMFIVCGLITIGCSKHNDAPTSVTTPVIPPTAPANLSITGVWTGTFTYATPCPSNGCVVNFTLTIDQSGSSISGTYSDSTGASGTLVGTVLTDTPTTESGTFTLSRYGYVGPFAVFSYSVVNKSMSFLVNTSGVNPFVKMNSLVKITSSSSASVPGLGL